MFTIEQLNQLRMLIETDLETEQDSDRPYEDRQDLIKDDQELLAQIDIEIQTSTDIKYLSLDADFSGELIVSLTRYHTWLEDQPLPTDPTTRSLRLYSFYLLGNVERAVLDQRVTIKDLEVIEGMLEEVPKDWKLEVTI